MPGKMMSYPRDEIFREVAYLAYHFHWSLDEIMGLDHKTRHRFIREISEINRKINSEREGG
jgi:hypothetical protein